MKNSDSAAWILLCLVGGLGCSRGTPASDQARDAPSSTLSDINQSARASALAPSVKAHELAARAEALAPGNLALKWLLEVLPCSWPETTGCVKYLAYDANMTLYSSFTVYAFSGPKGEVRCQLPEGECRLLERPPQSNIELEFRTDQSGGTPRPDEAAQQSLLEMVGSRQIPSQPPESLAPYARWLSDELQTGVLARKHNVAFAAWLGVPP